MQSGEKGNMDKIGNGERRMMEITRVVTLSGTLALMGVALVAQSPAPAAPGVRRRPRKRRHPRRRRPSHQGRVRAAAAAAVRNWCRRT